jgi:16S rRNA (cytosine1402-N4)-methyltransferase
VTQESFEHAPVLAAEALSFLQPEEGGLYLDGTVGGGGHAALLLEANAQVSLIGLDRDPEAVTATRRRLAAYGTRVRIVEADFRAAENLLETEIGEPGLTGALLDLGVSSHQIDTAARGFSFRRGTPLDMRMGGTTGGWRTAADLLNTASEAELGRIFREFGEERRWKALAREIVRRRRRAPLRTADDLVAACTAVLGTGLGPGVKARVFQAVRIAVNDELEALRDGLEGIRRLLRPEGRLVVISYHSLEDRIAKEMFRTWSLSCICPPEFPVCRCRGKALGRTLTRKPVRPSATEVATNKRARSALLRAWESS